MKKYALVFLSVFLFISAPFAAHANIVTATGKYLINAVKHVPGAVRVDATNTATGAKHVIKHGISSADLGKGIGAGIVGMAVGSGVGLAFQAITGLALDAVDWVMDKENNQIKWKKKGDEAPNSNQYRYMDGFGRYFPSPESCASNMALGSVGPGGTYKDLVIRSDGNVGFAVYYPNGVFHSNTSCSRSLNPGYDPSASNPYKSLPLVDLAKKVIEQADAGQVDSQKAIEEYVTNLAKEGELDAELDASTDITKPEGTEPDPDKDKECPLGTIKVDDICVKPSDSDPPLFCNSGEFTRKVCDWIDWTQEKPDDLKLDEGKIDVIDKSKDLTINENRIDFSNQCPAPTPINTSVGGFPISTELNYQPLCDFFVMLNPFVIGMGGISSALIIAGGIRRG